jgi:glycerol-3-phosphate dehydrogenase
VGAGEAIDPGDALSRRYGSRASEVRALIAAEPDLAQPLVDADAFLRAEVVHAVVHEGAMTLDDVVRRRLRYGLHLDATTPALLRETALLMSGPLGWDAATATGEVEAFLDQREAHR